MSQPELLILADPSTGAKRNAFREWYSLNLRGLGRLYPGRPSFAHKILTTAELVGALPRE
jgi:hypothetical protein